MQAATNCAEVDRANDIAIERITKGQPRLIDLRPAGEVVPGLVETDVLHAGPPFEPEDPRCGTLLGAIAGALIVEGRAPDLASAAEMARTGTGLRLRTGAGLHVMCTFGAVITAETPVFVVENQALGTRAYAAVNEGRGAVLRYGSTAPDTLDRVRWLHGEFARVLGAAIREVGGIDLFALMSQALAMGDELHSRQTASSALFLAKIAPWVCRFADTPAQASAALSFLAGNDFFFLPLAMAAAKSVMAAAEGVRHSSIVTSIAFNGARCGIRVSGLEGWCTAPVPRLDGRYFKGFDENLAGPVIGDSEIMETLGLGALSMANAPKLAGYLRGQAASGLKLTEDMYKITVAEHPLFGVPVFDGKGTPLGIDVRKVVSSRIAPVFNTGIAHVDPGVGQIGAGCGRVPLECFDAAVERLARKCPDSIG